MQFYRTRLWSISWVPEVWSLASAILLTLTLVGILLLILGLRPFPIFGLIVTGALGSSYNIAETFVQATPLLLAGLAVAVAFAGGLWNIGAEGQLYFGAIAALAVGLNDLNLPAGVVMPAALIAGVAGGAAWAFVPAVLKVKFHAQEVLVTIMLNYVALLLSTMVITGPWADPVVPKTHDIVDAAVLPILLHGTRLHAGVLIAFACVPIVWALMHRSVLGYRIRALGSNADTAALAGIPLAGTMVTAFCISGGLAGLAGAILVLGVQHSLVDGLSSGYGYTAIALALLGRLRPFRIMLVAVVFAGLYVGGQNMQIVAAIPVALVQVIISLFLLIILGPGTVAGQRWSSR